MNEAASGVESSFLLWVLAIVASLLSAYVGLGWAQRARRDPALRPCWRPALVAAVTLATGLSATSLLILSAEPLAFPLGYHPWGTPALWLGSVAACMLLMLALARSRRWWALLGVGLLFAALASALQVGWLVAAGLRPGIQWRNTFVAGAVVVTMVGLCSALWIEFAEGSGEGGRRIVWRLGAAALMTLSLCAAQELLHIAAGLMQQRGSVFSDSVPGPIVSLVCGVLLPLVLSAMVLDLYIRSQRRSRSGANFSPHKRRKRRHRARVL